MKQDQTIPQNEVPTLQVSITREEVEIDLEMYERDEDLQAYLKVMRGQIKYAKYKSKLAALDSLKDKGEE